MAKRRKTSKRKTAKYQGMTIVLPRGAAKLTAAHKAKIDAAGGPRRAGCRGVFFTATKFGVRCEGRKLSTSAKRRFKAQGGKSACMRKIGKRRLLFKSC